MDFLSEVLSFTGRNDWREVLRLNEKSDVKTALKILWVWPSESNLSFLKNTLNEHGVRGVTSLGCGCGLLEWLIQQYTGMPVEGFEINRAWWESKYAVPAFIPLRFVEEEEEDEGGVVQCNPNFALLFCYFNNGPAFKEFVRNYRGPMIIIIGPSDGTGRHTDPLPFRADFGNAKWRLVEQQEVKDTKDFIAIYLRQ